MIKDIWGEIRKSPTLSGKVIMSYSKFITKLLNENEKLKASQEHFDPDGWMAQVKRLRAQVEELKNTQCYCQHCKKRIEGSQD